MGIARGGGGGGGGLGVPLNIMIFMKHIIMYSEGCVVSWALHMGVQCGCCGLAFVLLCM